MGLESMTNGSLTWVSIENPTREKMNELQQSYTFHELNIEDCLSRIQHPKIDSYSDHIFVILEYPEIDKLKYVPRRAQLAIFAGSNYIITIYGSGMRPLSEMFKICKSDNKMRDLFMGDSCGYLLHSILDLVVDDFLHILLKLDGNLDDIEDVVFDEDKEITKEITLLQRMLTTIARILIPYRRNIRRLKNDVQRFTKEDLSLYYDDLRDHIDEVTSLLTSSRNIADFYLSANSTLKTNRTNRILTIIAVITTLTLPITVVGTLYGIIIDQPGGIQINKLHFFGNNTPLIMVSIILVLPPTLLLWYIKSKRWINI